MAIHFYTDFLNVFSLKNFSAVIYMYMLVLYKGVHDVFLVEGKQYDLIYWRWNEAEPRPSWPEGYDDATPVEIPRPNENVSALIRINCMR